MTIASYNLILGSKSPRRSELLTKAGIEYIQRVIETDESFPDTLAIDKIAEHIAIQKAEAHKGTLAPDELLLTADTIVVFDSEVYGKPKDAQEAIDTIVKLENKIHLVYSGVCLMTTTKVEAFTEMSEVKFGPISQKETEDYVRNFEPMDKAGSYGIQDWIGFTRIEWIKGSYTNILGLPLAQTYDRLKQFSLTA